MAPFHRPPRETDFASFPDSTPIVIDNGASTFRIGWAGEAEPRVAFRNIVQRPRHRSSAGETVTVVGDTDPALMKYFDCTRTTIRSPFDDDVVYQFEYMEYILDYGFDRLGATSEVGHPILMTECECNPSFSRARMSELLFETYGVPSVAFGIDDAFSYKYNQKLGNCGEDGLVISCEFGTCHVVPVCLCPEHTLFSDFAQYTNVCDILFGSICQIPQHEYSCICLGGNTIDCLNSEFLIG